MALGGQLIYVCYLLFLLSMVIVGLVFLTDQIGENKALIPNFNNTMYNFLYVGLWVVVAVTAVEFLVGIFSVGYLVNAMVAIPEDEEYVVLKKSSPQLQVKEPKRGRTRKLARQAERRRAASR